MIVLVLIAVSIIMQAQILNRLQDLQTFIFRSSFVMDTNPLPALDPNVVTDTNPLPALDPNVVTDTNPLPARGF